MFMWEMEAPAPTNEVFQERMTLARVYRQLRQEYLPVLRMSTTIAIH